LDPECGPAGGPDDCAGGGDGCDGGDVRAGLDVDVGELGAFVLFDAVM
jgi:hypothetical protein